MVREGVEPFYPLRRERDLLEEDKDHKQKHDHAEAGRTNGRRFREQKRKQPGDDTDQGHLAHEKIGPGLGAAEKPRRYHNDRHRTPACNAL